MFVFTVIYIYHIKTLRTTKCFDPCGTIINEDVNQMIFYKTLTN